MGRKRLVIVVLGRLQKHLITISVCSRCTSCATSKQAVVVVVIIVSSCVFRVRLRISWCCRARSDAIVVIIVVKVGARRQARRATCRVSGARVPGTARSCSHFVRSKSQHAVLCVLGTRIGSQQPAIMRCIVILWLHIPYPHFALLVTNACIAASIGTLYMHGTVMRDAHSTDSISMHLCMASAESWR